MTTQATQAIIPGSGSVSAGIVLPEAGLLGLYIAGPWTFAALTLLMSPDNGVSWLSVFVNNTELLLNAEAGIYIQLPADTFLGMTNVKVRSGTMNAPVAQNADASIFLITEQAPVANICPLEPNLQRTVYFDAIGESGVFPPFEISEQDVITFDVTGLLGCTGRTMETITSASLQLLVEGPQKAVDSAPASRVIRGPDIDGSLVSALLGNWQDVQFLQYAAELTFTTSFCRTHTITGTFAVTRLAPFPQNPPCIGCGALIPIFPMPWDF
jgi:hypothetical protein